MVKLELYRITCFFAVVAFSGCALMSTTLKDRSPASFEKLAYLLYPPVDTNPVISDLNFYELEKILKEKQFSKISDLLVYLSRYWPEYMSRYSLGYGSFSLHESSFSYPRAIVYGSKANFIISFNGNKAQRGFDLLEVVEFNQKEKRFEYREIQFNEKNLTNTAPFKISEIGGPSGKCLQCHRNQRPIWETYPIWPGFFGADDDYPIGKSANGSVLRVKEAHMSKSLEAWSQFKKSASAKDRYKYLPELADTEIFYGMGKRPNSDLGALIIKMNIERIAREIKLKTPKEFKYAYLFSSRCFNEPQFKLAKGLRKVLAKYGKEMDLKSLDHQVYRLSRLASEEGYDYQKIRNAFGIRQVPMNSDKFFRAIIRSNEINLAYQIQDNFKAIVSITSEFFPEIETDTWSSSLYEGVHRYSSGTAQENLWLYNALKSELFSLEEVRAVEEMDKESKLCAFLSKSLPGKLK